MSADVDDDPKVQDALVTRVDFRGCTLMDDAGGLLEATVRGRLMGHAKSLGNAVVVGDRVRFARDGGRAVIQATLPRRNALSRLAAGGQGGEQVVAANLDQVVLVTSIAEPEFRSGFADRVLCQAEHAGIPARVVINKTDLGTPDAVAAVSDDYARAGYPVQALCARSGDGVESLVHACRARRSLFVGHSGVGKSTLLNAMVPGLDLIAGDVNPKTGRGRHTTTAAWLMRPEPGLELIDTPGVRAFGLWGIGPRDLDQAYPEFRRHLGSCRFADCSHDAEPGCAVKAAVAAGEVATRRHVSYLKLRAELAREENRS